MSRKIINFKKSNGCLRPVGRQKNMHSSPIKRDIKEFTKGQLIDWLSDHSIRSFRATQILRWIYARQADAFDEMTDLKKETQELLAHHFTIDRLANECVETSRDGSIKYLFGLRDGHHIETVLIPEKGHATLCISSQVGCAQRCRFCLTARNGLTRNLTAGEIVSQVRDVKNVMDNPRHLTNIVVMGMGEPLANYDNLIRALNIILDGEWGLKFAKRKVTVSSAGVVPRLADLGRDLSVNLAISLNATDNKTRDDLMPINRRYPLEILLEACRKYNLQPHRRITFEYILIKGINDSNADARRLALLLRPIRAKINLIPFNEHRGSDFKCPAESVIESFQQILIDQNYTVMVRRSKGQDISAACGQLAAKRDLQAVKSSNV